MRRVAAFILAAALPFSAVAQTKLETFLSLEFASRDQWRGMILSDGPVLSPYLELNYGRWSASLWGRMELNDSMFYPGIGTGEGRFTEWDSTLSYNMEQKDFYWGVGLTHYDYPNTGERSTTEWFGYITSKGFLSPGMTINVDTDEADGSYIEFRASRKWSLEKAEEGKVDPPSAYVRSSLSYGSAPYHNYYFGHNEAGFSAFRTRVGMELPVSQNGEFDVWISYQSLMDGSLNQGMPKRQSFAFGISFGVRY